MTWPTKMAVETADRTGPQSWKCSSPQSNGSTACSSGSSQGGAPSAWVRLGPPLFVLVMFLILAWAVTLDPCQVAGTFSFETLEATAEVLQVVTVFGIFA